MALMTSFVHWIIPQQFRSCLCLVILWNCRDMENGTIINDSSSSLEHSRLSKVFSMFVTAFFLRMLKLYVSLFFLALAWFIVKYKMRLRRVEALKILSKFVHLI